MLEYAKKTHPAGHKDTSIYLFLLTERWSNIGTEPSMAMQLPSLEMLQCQDGAGVT